MEAALTSFVQNNNTNTIAFLGDMFELGEDAATEHQIIADLAKRLKVNQVFLVGENFYNTISEFPKFKSFNDLEVHLRNTELPASNILIKGSRGMAMERVLDLL